MVCRGRVWPRYAALLALRAAAVGEGWQPAGVGKCRLFFLSVQMTLGTALRAIKGGGAPEVERLYTRAHELCERVGEPTQLFRVLWGRWRVATL